MLSHSFGKVKSLNVPQVTEANYRNNITFDRIRNILCHG